MQKVQVLERKEVKDEHLWKQLHELTQDMSNLDIFLDQLEDQLLQNRYQIGQCLDKDEMTKARYEVVDTLISNQNEPLIIEVLESSNANQDDIQKMHDLHEQLMQNEDQFFQTNILGSIIEIQAQGQFVLIESGETPVISNNFKLSQENMKIFYYRIMKRCSMSLHDLFMKRGAKFTLSQIYSIGIQLINILERIHTAGYVCNNLNLENILLEDSDFPNCPIKTCHDIFEFSNLNLVNLDFATPFIDNKSGDHILRQKVDTYRGSMLFSSINHLNFNTTSRKDDMISLFYFMTYLLNEGVIPGIQLQNQDKSSNLLEQIKTIRKLLNQEDLYFGNTEQLEQFKKEVFSYKFNEEPNYDKLRNQLLKLKEVENMRIELEQEFLGIAENYETKSSTQSVPFFKGSSSR